MTMRWKAVKRGEVENWSNFLCFLEKISLNAFWRRKMTRIFDGDDYVIYL